MRRKNLERQVLPIELVDDDRAKTFFAMRSTGCFYLEKRVRRGEENIQGGMRTFSISAGMSSARRSLRETGRAVEAKRMAAGPRAEGRC